jgi:predicted site-specific integrase-resolvase
MQKVYSTVQAAQKLGLSMMTIHRYIVGKKIPVPPMQRVGNVRVRLWTDNDIERVREILPKIANGRKTRYQKKGKNQTTRKPKR